LFRRPALGGRRAPRARPLFRRPALGGGGHLVAAGTFVIGSHSATHRRLGDIPLDEAREEIARSRRALQARTGAPIDFFAYPGHSLNAEVMDAVAAAGYRGAVAGRNRVGQPYSLFRATVFAHYGLDEFRALLARNWVDDWSAPDDDDE
ncbi:MAG: polysaccharide deacetylase family protein, partial [Myxococcales bacterium]